MYGRLIMTLLAAATPAAVAAPPAVPQPPPSQPSPTQPSTRPATAPTTAPATAPSEPPDLSSPKAALRIFAGALYDGDGARLRLVVATTNPSEEGMVRAMADTAAAAAVLHRSAAKAFGAAAAERLTGVSPRQYAESLARIDAAEIAVDGDAAAVRYPGAAKAEYELKRIDGKWKVPATQFSHGTDAATLDRRMAEIAVQTRIVLDLAAEIAAGKHKDADTAYDAWRGKIMKALGLRVPATTTAPSGG